MAPIDKNSDEYKKKTSIHEDRTKPKTTEQLVKELEKKSFAQEIELDKNKSAVLIGRSEKSQELLASNPNDPVLKQEMESVAVYKRALILLGSSGIQINPPKGEQSKSGSEKGLPVSSYLSHGSRSLIQIPPGSNDDLINWLTSGNKETDGKSRSQDPNKAMSDGKYVYNRAAATHDVSFKEDKTKIGDIKVQEEKGFTIGLKSFLGNKVLGQETKHWGVDLAVDSEFGGKDGNGKVVEKPDGDHGHLYIHYTPATKDKPGSIMFGMEGAAPYSSKHSKTGASDPISPTGASKFEDLHIKKKFSSEKEYESTVVPDKYNGIYAELDPKKIEAITKLDDKKFSIELAEVKPGKTPEDFQKQIEGKDFHKTPELKAPKPSSKEEVQKPTRWQNIANKITLGNAYKKEINSYKAFHKEQKLYNKIASTEKEKVTEPKQSIFAEFVGVVKEQIKTKIVEPIKKEFNNLKEDPSKTINDVKQVVNKFKNVIFGETKQPEKQTPPKVETPQIPIAPPPPKPKGLREEVLRMQKALQKKSAGATKTTPPPMNKNAKSQNQGHGGIS